MSRIYDALKRAEGQTRPVPVVSASVDGPPAPVAAWDVDDEARLEYERLQVWITNPAPHSPPRQAIMVVSCQRGNGATTTAAGLAVTLAQRPAARVLIVDANLRTPGLHQLFGARGRQGFRELLDKGDGSGDYVQATAQPNLFVMTTGRISGSPLEAFAPSDLGRLVAQLKSRFDFILFDAAPLLEFPDAYALAPHVDAVLLVVEADRTLVDDARRAMRELDRSGVEGTGVVLNRQRDYTPRLLRRTLSRANGGRTSHA
ncbi:MAG TPA: CpsD/CapB family tyrosine-protein kinase [Methylomirabilota bacterium]